MKKILLTIAMLAALNAGAQTQLIDSSLNGMFVVQKWTTYAGIKHNYDTTKVLLVPVPTCDGGSLVCIAGYCIVEDNGSITYYTKKWEGISDVLVAIGYDWIITHTKSSCCYAY